jgi:D-aspartate ligase
MKTSSVCQRAPVVVLAPGYHGHAIARSLGRLGVPVHGVHGDERSPAARSRYWASNRVWNLAQEPAPRSVEWLLDLGHRIGEAPLLIPTDDDSCRFVDANATALRTGFRFPAQQLGLVERVLNKRELHELCREHGVPTAETAFPSGRDELIELLPRLRFPIMLKGEDTFELYRRTGRRMVAVGDPLRLVQEFDRLAATGSGLMVQELIPGGSDSVWMFNGYFDRDSNCLFGLTGRKLRQYPASRGVTSLGVCEPNPEVTATTLRLMRALGYRGVLDIGYKFDVRTGEYKLLDLNPRVGSSFRLFVDSAGTDVVRALYWDLTGQPVRTGQPVPGRRWVVENFDAVSALTHLRRRELGPLAWLRSYRGVQEAAWFAPDDLRPFAAMLRRSLAWAWERRR